MQSVKRFIEWYFEVPAADPGQGTAWNIRFNPPWAPSVPTWVLFVAIVAIIAWVVVIYWKDASNSPLPRRLSLIGLRLAVVAMLIAFLSGAELSVNRTGLPVVAVLIDDSASMGLEDTYPNADDEAAAAQLISEANAISRSRWSLARSLLLRRDGEFLREVLEKQKLRLYRFSEAAVPIGSGDILESDDLADITKRLLEAKPEGSRTRPGPAIEKVLDDLRGTPPAAIVVLSDGISSTGEADRLTRGAEAARDRLVPVYTIAVGSEQPTRDIQLYDLLVEEVAFINDPLTFSATVKSHGFAGRTVPLQLKRQGSSEVLATRSVKLPADGEALKVELLYSPPTAGEFDLTLGISPLEGETDIENNSETRHVSVREEKIRVLLADMAPRWEFRFVKHLLEREKTIELRTVLFDADSEYTSEDETALGNFPVQRDELFRFDVVILGDVNPALLSSTTLENLQAFVRDAGGGLIVVAGPEHMPADLRGTSLEAMLPVDLTALGDTAGITPAGDGIHVKLTVDGRKGTPIFRFADTDEETSDVWSRLPPLQWLVETPTLRPGARVFAEYRPTSGATALPVIALAPFGGGKVLFHATDELWRWRFRAGDLYFGRYWVQAIRYLSRSKLIGRDRNAELTVDRLVYEVGDPVNVRFRFFNERLIPRNQDGVRIAIERRGGARQEVPLKPRAEAPHVFEGQWRASSPGGFHTWAIAPAFAEAPPSADFRVESPQGELARRSMDRRELEQAATLTHGGFYTLADAERVPADLPPGVPMTLESQLPIVLWNRPELLGLFALLLTGEWILRKRSRLL
ncbi:MAG: hypothetical protein AB7O26_17890 [Planctomycetaceae bacterium]